LLGLCIQKESTAAERLPIRFLRDPLSLCHPLFWERHSVLLSFAGSQILLSVPFGSTKDQPVVTDPPPLDHKSVISELSIRVPDCSAAYNVLRSRGAEFLTPPFDWSDETRAFFHDPDGHLLEIREVREAEVSSE